MSLKSGGKHYTVDYAECGSNLLDIIRFTTNAAEILDSH